jgi:hypothetical protein
MAPCRPGLATVLLRDLIILVKESVFARVAVAQSLSQYRARPVVVERSQFPVLLEDHTVVNVEKKESSSVSSPKLNISEPRDAVRLY